jgi:hypothetical protein
MADTTQDKYEQEDFVAAVRVLLRLYDKAKAIAAGGAGWIEADAVGFGAAVATIMRISRTHPASEMAPGTFSREDLERVAFFLTEMLS